MWPEVHHHYLESATLRRLRPTQMSVGLAEVASKRREWAALGKKERQATLQRQVFPAVRDDLSWLEPEVFWRTMEFRSWAHPFDSLGRRCGCGEIPLRLTALQDDPYRSFAGRVHHAGGYAKSAPARYLPGWSGRHK